METLPPGNVLVMPARKTVRVCVVYADTIRALLWLNVGKDGSVYTGWSAQDPEPPSVLLPEVLPGGGMRYTWERVALLDPSERRVKTSFHASGVILSTGGRTVGVNLRLLKHRSFLCNYIPKHPDHWPVVEPTRKHDVVVRDLLHDECPISIDLYYQPAGALPVLASDLEKGAFVLPIKFAEDAGHQGVLLHLVFWRQPQMVRWAPRRVIGWPHLGRDTPVQNGSWFEPSS